MNRCPLRGFERHLAACPTRPLGSPLRLLGLALAALAIAACGTPRPHFGEPGEAFYTSGFDVHGASWSWVRPEATSWRLEDGALELENRLGTLWGPANSLSNIALRAGAMNSGSSASVVVDADVLVRPEQAGLIAYIGDDNYVKLVLEMTDQRSIVMVDERAGVASILGSAPFPHGKAELRFAWTADQLIGSVRPADGEAFDIVAKTDGPRDGGRIGVFAQGDGSRWSRFSRLVVDRTP